MRVLVALQDANLGGGQRVAARVAEGLRARGHIVAVAAFQPGPALRWFPAGTSFEGVRTDTLRKPFSVAIGAATLKRFDVLYSHLASGSQLAWGVAARVANRPHVAHQHTSVHFSKRPVTADFQRFMYRHVLCDCQFIAVTEDIQRDVIGLGISPQAVHVVSNGVEVVGTPVVRSASRLRVGMLARMYPVKRIDLFLESAAQLGDCDVEFVVGASEASETDYGRRMRGKAADLGIRLLDPGIDGVGFLQTLDVVVVPSDYEGLPLVLLESLALGKSVVAADIPSIRDVVQPVAAATLFRAGDPQALAGAIRELTENENQRQRMARIGPKLIRAKYSVRDMVARCVSVVESVNQSSSSGRAHVGRD